MKSSLITYSDIHLLKSFLVRHLKRKGHGSRPYPC
jgi:hypothetical protein